MPMKDEDLLHIIETAVQDTTAFDATFMSENESLLDRYLGNPYGDEQPERSKVISNDVMDVVESDMPSLVRVFLGSGEILKFKPNKKSNQEDVKEAKDKTKYVHWQIRDQDWSYPVISGFIKDSLIQKMGVVKYFVDESTEIEEHKKTGLNSLELSLVEESLDGEDVKSVEVSERSEEDELGRFDVTFKVERTTKQVKIINVPTERFLMTRNATNKNEASVVGDIELVTRGELLSRGFDREIISSIPQAGAQSETSSGATANASTVQSNLEDIRDADEGGADNSLVFSDWALEEVELENLYILVDYDEDGIAERRNVIRSGDIILENEVFNHVPYAVMSSIQMPHKAIGRSRAEITAPTARTKTAILRGIQDNIYAVNNPRIGANGNVHMDDLLVQRPNGIVRTKGEANPGQSLFPIEIPYIGDKALQVIQYWDQARAQSTGTMLASQGLDADSLGEESATRFEGVEKASQAKIELVARTMAETGFRDLFAGIAWLDSNFQDAETELEILGEELSVNPSDWKFKHSIVSNVGLGIGDDDKLLQTMTGFLQIHQQLAATGSPLTDTQKQYNILDRIVKGADLADTAEFFNNPEKPDELLQAENDILNTAVQQLQQQLQASANPLAEAEQIRAQAKLIEAQNKQSVDIAKAQEDQRQFNMNLLQKQDQANKELALKLTELEQKFSSQLNADFKQNEVSTSG